MLEINNLSMSYTENESILKNISLKIQEGECVLVTGESGSGKSSLIKAINGLAVKYEEAKCAGQISVFGKNTEELELYQLSMLIASVFQNPKTHFFNVNTTLELLFYLENIGLTKEAMDERLDALLKVFPVRHLLNRDIFKLSGGEKQILCVAACYISGAKIIVLDEPSSNLDEAYITILSQMLAILKARGITLIVSEHRLYYLMDLVDRVFLIQEGEVIKEYTRHQFLQLRGETLEALGLRPTSKQVLKVDDNSSKEGLKIKKLSYPFGVHGRLEMAEVTFEIGKIYGIVGKNGCGKSTFSRCFMGLERKCKDAIFLDGRKLSRKERLAHSAQVMQDVNHQLFAASVEEELSLGIRHLESKRMEEVLSGLGIAHLKMRHPMSLSGGEKQRVAIASVLCKDSTFIFFDEPTSGMDYKNMVQISRLIKKMKRQGNIIFIISHDNEFLNRTVDSIFNMEDYRVSS